MLAALDSICGLTGEPGAPYAKLVSRNAPLPRTPNPGPRHRRRRRGRRRLSRRARARRRRDRVRAPLHGEDRHEAARPLAEVHRATGPTASRRWTSSASKTARTSPSTSFPSRRSRDQRGDRHRRPDVLDERRHRPRRRVPCVRHQRHVRRHRAGRVDDHAAAREEPHPVSGARREPQGQGDRGRAAAEREVLEEEDPRGVSQHRLLRAELLRHQERGVALLHHPGPRRESSRVASVSTSSRSARPHCSPV